ncbi:hypothetical protein FUA48_14100 [Flavobacterium alkalisoli]|uniref:Uncharacterized protein n=1 Tax=Flavobacterium alkalisoli TaxID=2602769 RepID=A0A5B9FWM1_9FLAO|nr:hypothetical protein [Flavobacterium alkalisoli]QEE50669.1 hypothetical protein FUA48_14100 [Flavobacterium alkalisoli]
MSNPIRFKKQEFGHEPKKIKDSLQQVLIVSIPQPNTAYLDMTYVSRSNVGDNLELACKKQNLIIDLRNQFDSRVLLDMAGVLLPKEADFFKSTYADAGRPGLLRIKEGQKNFQRKAWPRPLPTAGRIFTKYL